MSDAVAATTAPAIPAGNNAFTEPVRKPDQSTADAKVNRISSEQYDRLEGGERLHYARQHDQTMLPEWRDPRTSPAEKPGDKAAADAIDVAKLQPDAKHKFVGSDGVEYELTGQQLRDAIAANAAETARRAALPADPSKYEFGFPQDFAVPGGVEVKLNPELPEAQDLARWAHRHGVSQDAFREVLAIEATRQAREVAAIGAARQREIDKLGATGVSRVQAVEAFLDSQGASGLKGRIFTGQDLADFEKIIGKRVSQGAAPMPQGKREPAETQGRASAEAYDKMSAHDRFAYARTHDQKNMPAWRDPRERGY